MSTGPSLVATQQPFRLEGTLAMARPRKRLQKPCIKQPKRPRQQLPIRPASGTWNDEYPQKRVAHNRKPPGQAAAPFPMPQVQPPDLSDSKWADYLGKGQDGIVGTMDMLPTPKKSPTPSPSPIREFAHLAPADTKRLSTDSAGTPTSSASSASRSLRRRAKTPVLRIGQLESKSSRTRAPTGAQPKRQRAEIMAEEYKALLEERETMHSVPPWENSPPRQQSDRIPPTIPEADSPTSPDREATSPPAVDLARCSPTSDDGTLVSFEDETIYFKPLAFSTVEPDSPSSIVNGLPASSSTLSVVPAQKSLSLQICLDLLTRELSSAILNRTQRSAPEVSALQVWVMIEAYERLRDQLHDTAALPPDQIKCVEAMVDTWLRALYAIHDSLAAERRNAVGRTDLDALQSEDLD